MTCIFSAFVFAVGLRAPTRELQSMLAQDSALATLVAQAFASGPCSREAGAEQRDLTISHSVHWLPLVVVDSLLPWSNHGLSFRIC